MSRIITFQRPLPDNGEPGRQRCWKGTAENTRPRIDLSRALRCSMATDRIQCTPAD